MKTIDLAYLAGVIDSDGSITIGIDKGGTARRNNAPRFFELVNITQVQPQAIQLAEELFGGNVSIRKPSCKKRQNLYSWCTRDRDAIVAITAMLPYLRIKREQGEILLAFRAVKDRGRMMNTYLEEMAQGISTNRWGSKRSFRRRFLKPEVITEYTALAMRIRSLNTSQDLDPFATTVLANGDAVVEIAGGLTE